MKHRTFVALSCVAGLAISGAARADVVSDLQAHMEVLQKQLDQVKTQLYNMQEEKKKESKEATGGSLVRLKPNSGATFLVPGGGEVQLYGHLDVSFDTTTKGLKSDYGDNGGMPVGKLGWMPAISTNLSRLGVKGKHPLKDDLDFVWQLEAGLEISATPGTKNTNSNTSDSVNGALFSRNSFLGFAGKEWGAVKIGKSETPYKLSTDPLNPFSGMLGDYRVIMGNSGGDNRVEFGLRAPHALWYESPSLSGFSFKAMYAPGQNRSNDNSDIASAEQDCAGGNVPGSGGGVPFCNDGSFGNLYSVSGAYKQGPLYVTAAYELHKDVNRVGDLANLDPRDTADERAAKIGVQYKFPTNTTVNALYENMHRTVPADLQFQNERTRNSYWLALTQVLTAKDNVSFGWAHANATPGDPGTHNTPGGANPDNAANMYTFNWRHAIDKSTSVYADWAMTVNHPDAHFDLGAGGHSVTTDCHDASIQAAFDPTTGGVTGDGPHCFAGGRLQGFSVGVVYNF